MRKVFVSVLVLLILALAFQGLAEQKYCEDTALVLSSELETGVEKFSTKLKEKKQLEFYVNTIHFLGTKNKADFAKKFLSDKGENSCVLLLVIGEDSYYFYSKGKAKDVFKQSIVDASFAKSLRQKYMDRQYDEAVASFIRELCVNTIGESYLKSNSYLSSFEGSKQAKNSYNDTTLDKALENLVNNIRPKKINEKSTNVKGLVVWFCIIYFLFIRKSVRRRKGCGCFPFI